MHLTPHFQALTLLLLTNIFHHVLVLDCDSGTWSGWTECNNCRQTRHLISSSTSPLCEPLADTQLCEECGFVGVDCRVYRMLQLAGKTNCCFFSLDTQFVYLFTLYYYLSFHGKFNYLSSNFFN